MPQAPRLSTATAAILYCHSHRLAPPTHGCRYLPLPALPPGNYDHCGRPAACPQPTSLGFFMSHAWSDIILWASAFDCLCVQVCLRKTNKTSRSTHRHRRSSPLALVRDHLAARLIKEPTSATPASLTIPIAAPHSCSAV